MTKYTEQESHIERENEDGTITFIPKDDCNSDYQAYLADEAETK
jgi:hypothetical protein